jgi:hypothetical protein
MRKKNTYQVILMALLSIGLFSCKKNDRRAEAEKIITEWMCVEKRKYSLSLLKSYKYEGHKNHIIFYIMPVCNPLFYWQA